MSGSIRRTAPSSSGWLSSYYGKRTDPFTGKPANHTGIDFAGKIGNDIIAVADGVVTWSGEPLWLRPDG